MTTASIHQREPHWLGLFDFMISRFPDFTIFPMLSRFLILLVYCYRATLGRFMGGQCRFHPTCSQYMIDAIHKHGPIRGGWRGVKRICRCHPWGGSGYDPA